MSSMEPGTVPVAFRDVAACFAEEDWKLLHEGQKVFYRNVVKEVHRVLLTMGYQILNPESLLRVIKQEDANHEDPEIQRKAAGLAITTSSHSTATSPPPDILLRVKCEQQRMFRDNHSSEDTDIANSLRNVHPFDPSVITFQIKEEDEMYPIDYADSDSRHDVYIGPENSAIAKTENLLINSSIWDNNRKEINPTKDGQAQSAEKGSEPSEKSTFTEHEEIADGPFQVTKSQSCQVRRHKCEYCNEDFVQHSRLMTHMRIHTEHNMDCEMILTGEKPYNCTECKKSFSWSYALKVHQRVHRVNPYGCTECKNSFPELSALRRHQRSHTGEKPYKCTECEKTFTKLSNQKEHQMTHTGEKPYECTACSKTFSHQSALKRHQRIHTGEKPFECTECKRTFTQLSTLTAHHMTHTGEKPYECRQCKKTFTKLSALKVHQRIHTGEKPFECTECKKTFNESSTLKVHLRRHTGEKPYECTFCTKCFPSRQDLHRHQKTHSREKPYECI